MCDIFVLFEGSVDLMIGLSGGFERGSHESSRSNASRAANHELVTYKDMSCTLT